MLSTLVLDAETKQSFQDVGGRFFPERLGVSLVGVYEYATDRFSAFREQKLKDLGPLLSNAALVIGYNIKGFDWKVLQPYFPNMALSSLPTLDLMEDVAQALGFRVKLNDLVNANLGAAKSGSGLDAIQWYREGDWEKLERYCLDDVRLTKELFDFGCSKGAVKVQLRNGEERMISVSWSMPKEIGITPSLFS